MRADDLEEATFDSCPKTMPPDFTGTWLNTEIIEPKNPDGTIECTTPRFMEEGLEMNFVVRNLAKAAGYGLNKMEHKIKQNEDGSISFEINLPEKSVFTWIIDGEEHTDQNGRSYCAKWEGDVLSMHPGPDAKSIAFSIKRYMEGETMVTDLYYPSKPGVRMMRKFTKQ